MSNSDVYLDEVPLANPTYVAVPSNTTPQTTYYAKEGRGGGGTGNGGSYSLGMYICICLVIAGLIIGIIAVVSIALTSHNQQTMNTFIAQWHTTEEERLNHADLPSRMIAVSERQRGITLCAIQTYHTESGGIHRPLLTQTIEEIRSSEMKGHTFHHINVRLYLSIETDPEGKFDRPHLSIMYNMTSTLKPFSTIRLEELEFDTQTNAIGPMRSIVLCSNNVELNAAQRCDDKALLSKRNLFVFHGQDTVTLLIVSPATPEKDVKTQATVDLQEEEPLISLRMYNVVFYTQELLKETRVLTIEPLQC